MQFELPQLTYQYNHLEPLIDAKTMEIHHSKHHQAYVNNLNAALKDSNNTSTIEEICKNISKYPMAVRNNGGGHFNHTLFWQIMDKPSNTTPSEELLNAINKDLGGMEQFKTDFIQAATTRFGSGWAWLCVKADGTLCVCSTPNQDNPLMDIADCKATPILCLDVWEHAYYLNYQNRRPDYITAFFNVINWNKVSELYTKAK